MFIVKYLRLVEIQTKVASVIPFILGTLYAIFRFGDFDFLHFALMFISLLSFDMATTAINNYYDYMKAKRKHGYGYEVHNAIVQYHMNPRGVAAIIAVLLVLAIGAGLWLFMETGWLLLLLGGLSFAVGILYSFGPLAISRMPLGEIFSGLFMGFVIPFVSVYIHAQDKLASLDLDLQRLTVTLHVDLLETLLILLISIPAILGIANIMLANNICDVEDDIENRRYTLPVYIGRPRAIRLFGWLYYVSYIDLIVLIVLKVPFLLVILALATLIPVRKNLIKFADHPVKQFTFKLAVQNFVLISAGRIVILALALLFML